MDWVLPCEPRGCWFHSQLGHMPGLQARSPVGGIWEATTHWCFSPSLSPSLLLSLKINNFLKDNREKRDARLKTQRLFRENGWKWQCFSSRILKRYLVCCFKLEAKLVSLWKVKSIITASPAVCFSFYECYVFAQDCTCKGNDHYTNSGVRWG